MILCAGVLRPRLKMLLMLLRLIVLWLILVLLFARIIRLRLARS